MCQMSISFDMFPLSKETVPRILAINYSEHNYPYHGYPTTYKTWSFVSFVEAFSKNANHNREKTNKQTSKSLRLYLSTALPSLAVFHRVSFSQY